MKTKVIRINYRDLVAMKRILPAYRGESVANYFHRFIEYAKKAVADAQEYELLSEGAK
jgi:hypothetical protein